MKFNKHKWQGISLIIAALLLWLPWFPHFNLMTLATIIILINAIMEFM